jgi:hypothetical protein
MQGRGYVHLTVIDAVVSIGEVVEGVLLVFFWSFLYGGETHARPVMSCQGLLAIGYMEKVTIAGKLQFTCTVPRYHEGGGCERDSPVLTFVRSSDKT